ncbi:Uncharacterized protein HZ326_3578 [Fusarium oxysporum f. sp. albedinis]|nr:Uncharacterized protein HZ326_3578 [Fusarium oxysporum f. sp. albedinis]
MHSWKDGEWRGRSPAKWEHTPLEHGIDRQSKEHGVFACRKYLSMDERHAINAGTRHPAAGGRNEYMEISKAVPG